MNTRTSDGKTIEVKVDRELCIGAATCVAIAPLVFALDNQNKAIIKETASEDTSANIIEAAKSCPVIAIIVKDESGKQIYP